MGQVYSVMEQYSVPGGQLLIPLAAYQIVFRGLKYALPPEKLRKYSSNEKHIQNFYSYALSLLTSLALLGGLANHTKEFLSMDPREIFNRAFDDRAKTMLLILMSYITHDTIWCISNGFHDRMNYIHHAISVTFCAAMLHLNNTCYEAVVPIFVSEMSNVPLNLRWFHRFFRNRNSFPLDATFALTFTLGRVGAAGYMTYLLTTLPGPKPVRVACYMMDVVNLFWFKDIVKMVWSSQKSVQDKKNAKE